MTNTDVFDSLKKYCKKLNEAGATVTSIEIQFLEDGSAQPEIYFSISAEKAKEIDYAFPDENFEPELFFAIKPKEFSEDYQEPVAIEDSPQPALVAPQPVVQKPTPAPAPAAPKPVAAPKPQPARPAPAPAKPKRRRGNQLLR